MNVKSTTRLTVELTSDEAIMAIIYWLSQGIGNTMSCNLAARIQNGEKRKVVIRDKKLVIEFYEKESEET